MALPVTSIRSQFPIFGHRPGLIYLDNAATSQKPLSVIQSITKFYEQDNANIHRGLYDLSAEATRSYESVRKDVAKLIGARDPKEIAFTSGTTSSINLIAQGFLKSMLKPGDEVLISLMEHHANLIPWQQVCRQTGAVLKVVPVTPSGELDLHVMSEMMGDKTRMLAVTHISNVLGTINPVEEIVAMAHQKNVLVLIDAAQSAGHYPIDVKRWDADFLAFSAHKMFGPMGTGVLYAKEQHATAISPLHFGGGGIRNVEMEETEFADYPQRLEAGTANVAGVVGLGAAMKFVEQFDMTETAAYTENLRRLFVDRCLTLGGITMVGNPAKQAAISSFTVEGIHAHDVAGFLAHAHIAVRAGHHCAQPLLDERKITAAVRVSFSIYNTMADVDQTLLALADLEKFWA